MKRFILLLILLSAINCHAELVTLESVRSNGGDTVYYILGEEEQNEENFGGVLITSMNLETGAKTTLVEKRMPDKIEDRLFSFFGLKLSVDGKTLYFQNHTWATDDAIHSLDIKSKKTQYITYGALICEISKGEYQGKLLISQRRFFIPIGTGDYYFLYLYDKNGKELGIVSNEGMSEVDRLKKCQSLDID